MVVLPRSRFEAVIFWGTNDSIPVTNGNGLSKTER